MHNFFEKPNNSSNPFAKQISNDTALNVEPKQSGKRLNIVDMEVLNADVKSSEIEFLEMKINNLHQLINQYPQTMDPVALEKLKIEWEDLRARLHKLKQNNSVSKKTVTSSNVFKSPSFISDKFYSIMKVIKFYSPKIKGIVSSFKEINKEVEDLVNKATPLGEEDIKYGILVNRIYQASKLNCKLSNEIK